MFFVALRRLGGPGVASTFYVAHTPLSSSSLDASRSLLLPVFDETICSNQFIYIGNGMVFSNRGEAGFGPKLHHLLHSFSSNSTNCEFFLLMAVEEVAEDFTF